jgi:hypothetical protein
MGLEPVIGCPDPGGELTASKKLATHFIIPFRRCAAREEGTSDGEDEGAGRELNYERRDPLTKGYVEQLGQPSPVAYRCILFLMPLE